MLNSAESGPKVEETEQTGAFRYFTNDLLASVVVFLVALPLCIGIAVAVGVNPARALITGIIGGLIVGSIAGSPLQVSGPAAGLFVIVADIIFTNRDKHLQLVGDVAGAEQSAMAYAMAALGCAVVLAGIMQLVAGKMKLGRWFRAVSPAVIKGMLSGIGALILISQFHVMLDHSAMWGDKPARGGLQYLATIPAAITKCFTEGAENHHLAAMIGIVTIGTIIAWSKFAPKKISFIPGALVGIVVATLFAIIANFEVIQLSVPDNMFSEVSFPNVSWFGLIIEPSIWVSAFVIALVASAATLLTAAAVDDMSRDIGVKTDYDQELISQGVGNTLCGLVGALPMTGVIVRSSANVHAGARTRKSTIIHGAWLLLFVCFLPQLLTYIPKSALGALLVYTGFKLLNPAQLKGLWKVGKSEAAIYLTTLAIIVSVDLLIGVMVGVALSAGKLLHRFSHLDVELVADEAKHRYELKLRGAATFLRLPILAEYLDQLPGDAELHVCLEKVDYIDHACFELLMNWAESHVEDGGSLVMDWDRLHGAFQSEASESAEDSTASSAAVLSDKVHPAGVAV
ncbi:SulP family inorganic anion transporter [Mariniblastus fucicola]|uniref:C4-dicarboxylic acid transporter DauA n=1 Tax=Mariniblastus fucicola TaxID=980251 RepID=A0A5B9P6W3_9BACT|nr:SulP family inorganic anion transporter [Mariniblastus fucicola]QEG20742.1 C4-dicarboxylic acid transporter DauA [Mariniblastus fucicola]